MRFQTGISIGAGPNQDVIVSAVTWFEFVTPTFSTIGITMPRAKNNLLATVVVQNPEHTCAVNAVCQRTLEMLLVKGCTSGSTPMRVELLVKPALARNIYLLPCKRVKNHWLLNAANAVLSAWLNGER